MPVQVDAVAPEVLAAQFRRIFTSGGEGPVVVARAPGRVNLIGEHTDYNDGFVMPVAVDRQIILVGQRAAAGAAGQGSPEGTPRIVRLVSRNFGRQATFDLDHRRKETSGPTWVNYPQGVADVLERAGYRLPPMNILVWGNVPLGAGMSSSAAFEVASIGLYTRLIGVELDPRDAIRKAQQAENEFVGVQCGIMDQFISRLGRAGHALLLDCRSLDYEQVPMTLRGFRLGVCHSGVSRGLAASAYNQRRAECDEGVALLRRHMPHIRALRDVTCADLERYGGDLPPVVERRCRHVVEENARVQEAAVALRAGDLTRLGELLVASHASLRDLYEVSSRELDTLVELAMAVPGVAGARLTGAGFGGCTVNLVREDAWDDFTRTIETQYPARTGKEPTIYHCHIVQGAQVWEA
jgi:galactokinase